MQRKLIALDLDGTTLNQDAQLSPKTTQTLTELQSAGHIVSIVTGRPNRLSQNFYQQLGLTSPMVNFNGALAHIPGQKWADEYQYTVNKDIVFALLQLKDQFKIQMVAAEGKTMFLADQAYPNTFSFFPATLKRDELLTRDSLQQDPTAITVFVERSDQVALRQMILDQFPQVDVNTWGGPASVLEIVHHGIQKAKGLAHLADYYQIDQHDILAFGDESNDLEMLDYAGLGVAMHNAIAPIKAIANDVTPLTNAQDGVANYLIQYFNLA